MQPINMIMIYYWDKKLKKRLHVLQTDIITIKKTIYFMSLAQRMHILLDVFQMTATAFVSVINYINRLHLFWDTLYIYVYIYEVHTISFQTFFKWAFKIVIDSWKFSMLLLYIWPIFIISGSNEQLHQELEYILLKPNCHSWWISKMQSDTLEERYAIKFCFKLGKKATEMYECFRLHELGISFWVA